jgi:predicted AlkP superfamily pyrophosphatase or phosphodiesterase
VKNKTRLIVFSVDAMVKEDMDYLQTLPNFRKYLGGGSEVKRMRTIYPTVTYPAHTSIMTGCYPAKHGVVSNYTFTTESKSTAWHWMNDVVKTEDIFTAAKKGGYSTAAVFWPVLGNHKSIDYLINEYWLQYENEDLLDAFRHVGSDERMIEIIQENEPLLNKRYKLGGHGNFLTHPEIDDFLIGCASSIIRKYQPEVLFVHTGNLDDYRHKTGVFNETITRGVEETDKWLGQLMKAVEDIGALEDTNLFMISDHGQLDVKRIINPNVILADNGLITVSPDNKVEDYKAYCFSGGMSVLVYLKDPDDKETYDKTYALLKHMCDEGIYGISQVFTREESAEAEHLDGDFSFVLETDGYTAFGDSCVRPIVTKYGSRDVDDYRFGTATHGYLPDKGPQPVLAAKGPSIKNNVVLERRRTVDEAPTFAKILGVALPEADGVPIEEILK